MNNIHSSDSNPTRATYGTNPSGKIEKRCHRLLPFLAALLCFCVICGVIVGAILWFTPIDSLKYAPDGCRCVMVINIDQVENTEAFETLKESPALRTYFIEAGRMVMDDPFECKALEQAGIAQLVYAGGDSIAWSVLGDVSGLNRDEMVIVLKTRRDITAGDLLHDTSMKGPFAASNVNGYTINEGADGAFCVVDKRRLVIARAATLREILTRGKQPDLSDNLKAALKKADFSKAFAFAIDTEDSARNSPYVKGMEAMELRWVAVEGAFDQDIDLSIIIQSKSAQGAKEVKKTVDELTNATKLSLTLARATGEEKPDFFDEPKIAVSGSVCSAKIRFKADGLVHAAQGKKAIDFFSKRADETPRGTGPIGK
jgi:hypothetical protein